MAPATTPSPAKQYVIRYTIRDGEHDYQQQLIELFHKEPTERQVVAALVDNLRMEQGDLREQQQAAWKQYQRDMYLEIPGDYRILRDFTWDLEK